MGLRIQILLKYLSEDWSFILFGIVVVCCISQAGSTTEVVAKIFCQVPVRGSLSVSKPEFDHKGYERWSESPMSAVIARSLGWLRESWWARTRIARVFMST